MHRRPLLELLDRYRASHPSEAPVVDRVRALAEGHADCFRRDCLPGHVTGSAWVLSHDRSRCLLVHHAKLDRWLQPGGHCDGEPDPAAAALREAREETGLEDLRIESWEPLDLDVHLIPARLDADGRIIEPAHEHHDVRFLVVAAAGQRLVCSEESHDVRWFTRDEVLATVDEESVLRMLRKAGPAA